MAKMKDIKPMEIKKDSKKKANADERTKEIQKLILEQNSKHGENALVLGGFANRPNFVRIPTGSISLTLALGGGIPEGRFTQFSGALSSTKTTQAIHIVREAQKLGYVCAYYDVEGTTTKDYIEQLGADVSNLLYSLPDGQEECLQSILDLQRSGLVNLAVIDSLEALSPVKEQDSEMDETVQMGVKQKLFGEFFRKYTAGNNRLSREGKRPFTLIGINQLREKIGAYGDPEYYPGGRAIGHYASVDIRLRKGDWLFAGKGENKQAVGQVTKFKIEKNKTYKRMQTGEFDFYYADNPAQVNAGYIDNLKEILIEAIAWGLIDRTGAWFILDDLKFQGKDALIDYFRSKPEVVNSLYSRILELMDKVR